jgi:GT2 family glycosyltransferase
MLDDLPAPYRLVYVDGGSPPRVRDALAELAVRRDFTLVRTEHYLSGNEARNLAFDRVDTEFVAFLDNDVFLSPGWLPTLEAAADRHGAAVVAPVYGVAKDKASEPEVHVAGSDEPVYTAEDGRRRYRMGARHEAAAPEAVLPTLEAEPTAQAEFHCFFARTDAVRGIMPLDEQLPSMNEHIDAALRIRAGGGTVWLEPSVFVVYRAPKIEPSDLRYHVLRWSPEWNRTSIRRFEELWDIHPDDPTSEWLLRQCDYRRYRAYRPYRSVIGRLQAYRGRHSRPLPDRVLTPIIVRREEARRRRARPPVTTHRASWDRL